jgi:hypothetical protein
LGFGKDFLTGLADLAGTFFGFAHAPDADKISGKVMIARRSISVS